MQIVHIYAESETADFRSMDRGVGYVLEAVLPSGKTVTREKFQWMTGTYNEVILRAFNEALGRMTGSSEIHLHTQDKYILTAIDRYLDTWEVNDFRNAKGEEISSAVHWKAFAKLIENHLVCVEPGHHSYLNWMINEMKHGEPA